jgi:hypothetical protein
MGEGSFVMTELGSSTVLYSLTAVFKEQGRSVVNLLIFPLCILLFELSLSVIITAITKNGNPIKPPLFCLPQSNTAVIYIQKISVLKPY